MHVPLAPTMCRGTYKVTEMLNSRLPMSCDRNIHAVVSSASESLSTFQLDPLQLNNTTSSN